MTNSAPSLTPSRIEALVRLAQGALMVAASMLLALAERANGRHRRPLKPFVTRLERTFWRWLFLSAVLRVPEPLRARSNRRPRSAPHGFARARVKGCAFFRTMRTRLHDRDLAARLRCLHAIVRNPERAVARLTKRLETIALNGLKLTRLIAIAPPALTHSTSAIAPAPALADSS